MAISDIIVLIVFVVTIIICTKRGLILTLFSMSSTAVSIIGAWLLRPVVSGLLSIIGVEGMLYNHFFEKINAVRMEHFAEATSVAGEEIAKKMNLPGFMSGIFENQMASWNTDGSVDKVVEDMSHSLASISLSIISIVALFIVLFIVMFFLKKFLKVFDKIPVIRSVNKIGGFIAGAAIAFLWLSVIGLVLNMFGNMGLFTGLVGNIESSLFAKIFYENNFIGMLLSLF